jgi:hypothetical protein
MRSNSRCSLCLQFALILGAGPVLHRPTSLVIHRLELNLSRFLRQYNRRVASFSGALLLRSIFRMVFEFVCAGRRPAESRSFARARLVYGAALRTCRWRPERVVLGAAILEDRPIVRLRSDAEPYGRLRQVPGEERALSARPSFVCDRVERRTRSASSRSVRERERGVCSFFKVSSLMILPQVHLRKPCYDFYFL